MAVRFRPTARFGELRLLFWVVLLALFGSVAVRAAAVGDFRPDALALPAAVLALGLALHVLLVVLGSRGDQLLLPLALALTSIGLVLVERLAPDRLLVPQLSWLVIASGAFIATLLVPRDLTALSRYKWTWAFIGILLLLSPLFPVIGREINGSRIWIGYGDIFNFQPSEAVKILLVVFFAAYLEEYREVIAAPRRLGPIPIPPVPYLAPILLMWAMAMIVMVLQKDLGATLLFFGVFLAMLYLATGRVVYVVLGVVMLLAGGYVAYELFAHVQARVDTWLRPFAEEARFGPSFQLVQGLFALGNGGLLGTGLGGGMPERIPVVWSDFVFAAFTEETGFMGAVALLSLYLILFFRGMTIALRAPTPFLQLLAGGLSFSVAFQTLVIVAGNAKLIPLTGVTLPFVSYGGSSLVTNFILVALLLRVHDITARVRGTS